jgi:hypothetical protein
MPYVTCQSPGCSTRTLPRIAAAEWPGGVCELCRDPELRAWLSRALRRARIYLETRK